MTNGGCGRWLDLSQAHFFLGFFLGAAGSALALTNGLARTPPMGWSSWYRFFGSYDETVLRGTCDAMATNGLQAAGYHYVILDDCATTGRDADGALVVDSVRFPSGMKGIGEYIHAKGLGFGVYVVASTYPGYCGGPPSYALEARDVATCVSWGIDCLRVDGLGGLGPTVMETAEAVGTRWHRAVMGADRPILLSFLGGAFEPWKPVLGNICRISSDIGSTWSGVTNNLSQLNRSVRFGGPGGWVDPDMIFIGNPGVMSDVENRAFFSMWCVTASPLILGSDVRVMTEATRAIVTAPELIAVDQDPLGVQGRRIQSFPAVDGEIEIWSKPLVDPNSRAVALFNRNTVATNITVNWTNLQLQSGRAAVRDLWARTNVGMFLEGFTASVPAHGAVVLKVTGQPMAPPVALSALTNRLIAGAVQFDGSFSNQAGFPVVTLGGVYYPSGLAMVAPASVTYDLTLLTGIVTRLVAEVGLEGGSGPDSAVAFEVWADGIKRAETGRMTATGGVETISVDLRGRRSLTLSASGRGIAGWGDARLLIWPESGPPTFEISAAGDSNGMVTIAPSPHRFEKGELARLTAVPSRWHALDRWEDGTTNIVRAISVESNAHYTAAFRPMVPLETLAFGGVSRRAPVGMPAVFLDGEFVMSDTVTRPGPSLLTMATSFDHGTVWYALEEAERSTPFQIYTGAVTLTHSAVVHSFAVNADFTALVESDPVEVRIQLPSFPLSAGTWGGGLVAVEPAVGPYWSNSIVTMTASPDAGWEFLHWAGDIAGSNMVATMVMDGPKSVRAVFGTRLVTGTLGPGTVLVDPVQTVYPFGAEPRLTAVPHPGSYFAAWGNEFGTDRNPLRLPIASPQPVATALFLPLLSNQAALTVIEIGPGTVTRSPWANLHTAGQEVRLNATPEPEFIFDGWGGDATGKDNPLVLLMSESRVLTARFVRDLRLTVWLEPAGCRLRLASGVNGIYSFEASNDLHSWDSLTNRALSNGAVEFLDTPVTNFVRRFYRARRVER